MRLTISENVNSRDWDEKICSTGGTIFHSSTWAKYIVAGAPHVIPQFISLVSDNGEFLGAALGFEQGSRNRLIRYFNKFLWFDAIPIVRDHDKTTLYEFLQLIEDYARRSGYIELSLGSFASSDTAREMEQLRFDITKRLEFVLDLACSEDDLWKGMLHKRRKNINKATRNGVTINTLFGEEGITELRKLQIATYQRIQERGGPEMMFRQAHGQNPLNILIKSGYAQVVCASVEGAVVSASLFTFFNDMAYHNLSGHSPKAFETQAPTLLLWETIKKCQHKGVRWFNLSGCKATAVHKDSSEHGVYEYKKAFSGRCVECCDGKKILRRTHHKALTTSKKLLKR